LTNFYPIVGHWHHYVVCLSVSSSVCDAVHWWHSGSVESCTTVFLGWHFLFTSSDTFVVGCIIQPQLTAKCRNAEISMFGKATGHGCSSCSISAAIPYFVISMIGLLYIATLLVKILLVAHWAVHL